MWVSVVSCNNRNKQYSMLHVSCIIQIFLLERTQSTVSDKMYPVVSDMFWFF